MDRRLMAVAGCLVAACVGNGTPATYPDPTVSTDPGALVLKVEAPLDFAVVTSPDLEVRGTATAGAGVPVVTVSVGDRAAFPVAVTGGAFSTTVSLRHVGNRVRVTATLPSGERADVVRMVSYNGAVPGILWVGPDGDQPVGGATARVSVVATAPEREVITGVRFDAGAGEVAATTEQGIWVADVPLPAGGDAVTVRAVATDTNSATGETSRTYAHDLAAPTIAITAPAAGTVLTSSTVEVTGTAADDRGIERVEVRVGSSDPEPATGTSTWSAQVYLEPGTHVVTATVIDVSGQRTESSVTLTLPRIITLRPPAAGGDLTLTLDVNGLKSLIPEADQRTITLLYVDLEPVLVAGLDAIKDPVAAGLDTSGWGQAERNMQRLLNMSPDNANLSGTSLEEVLTLSPNLGLPPGRMLADIAGVEADQPFLSAPDVVRAMLKNVIESHPNVDIDPADGKKKVRATMYDALRNFSTLAGKFGPAGGHPGFLTGETFAEALKPNFAMTVTARSNLTPHEGVNVGQGKGFLFVNRTPGTGTILEFDFLDPERFKVVGIADQPTVDMVFFMNEHNGFVSGGSSQTARPDGSFFQGNSPAWDLSPWLIEHMVIDAVYLAKRDRFSTTSYQQTFTYDVGALSPAATVTWDKGWISMMTAGGLGNPPPPAYFWDHLIEAVQKRLHDGVAEGQARVQFALTRIPLGLTGDQLKERIRPQMEAQKSELSRILLGDQSSYTSNVTFYMAQGADGLSYLYFTAPGDIPGASPYPFSTPGFFADEALSLKVSGTVPGGSGDSIHEKVLVTAPATFYVRGADSKVYKIELLELVGSDLRVRVVAVAP